MLDVIDISDDIFGRVEELERENSESEDHSHTSSEKCENSEGIAGFKGLRSGCVDLNARNTAPG